LTLNRFLAMLLVASSIPAAAVEPYLAAPVSEGSLDVRLVPTEAVTPGADQLVTFGVPFPRGSITNAGLASVRVLRGGAEIPAHVSQMTPWRHRLDPSLDGTSVRVARVQIHYSFAAGAPEAIQLAWGGEPRQLDVAASVPARDGWHTVASGSFIAADDVQEPDVYAVLPKHWLARGVLKGNRTLPFDDANTEARDDPAVNAAIQHWSGYTEADRAAKNNFYNIVNQDDPRVSAGNQAPYRTTYEPWLYDRAASMFTLYLRSGFPNALREAVRASDFYGDHLTASGHFDMRDGDTKYAYAENLAYRYWLTGDETALQRVAAVASAQDGFNHSWSPSTGFWTERHAGFKLLAHQVAYELEGGAYAEKVASVVSRLAWHQDGADGQIPRPSGYVDGGLYHYGSQHDGDWADGELGASSWMSTLVVDAMLRAYATSEDPLIANFVRRMGNFLRASTVMTLQHQYDNHDGALALPRYAMLSDGSDGQVNDADVEHALDVAAGIAWAHYFAQATGQGDASLAEMAETLYFTYDEGVNFWIRPNGPNSGLPAYRVSPWRKYAWEHRVSGGLGWAMAAATERGDPVFADGFE
jgi:hypothetical protein